LVSSCDGQTWQTSKTRLKLSIFRQEDGMRTKRMKKCEDKARGCCGRTEK
jgi:hypothetical protein